MGNFHYAGLVLVVLLFTEYPHFCLCRNLSSGCTSIEGQALLEFKQSLEDPSNRLASWEGTECCKWEGVDCDRSKGHVVKLDLRNANSSSQLQATEINSSLLELRNLNYLDLSGNNFNGSPIPEFLGLMKQLRYLNLSTAHFLGVVPSQLRNLTKLQVLDISNKYYEGSLIVQDTEWLSHMLRLQHLGMNYVDLSGAQNLFQVLGMLPSLSVLSLSWCRLGYNPHLSPAQMNSTLFSNTIQQLDLSFNSFQGPFPHFVQTMTSLRVLDLSLNQFNSSIPLWLGNLKNLVYLNLADNKFSSIEGGLSMILHNLCHLKSIDLSNNIFKKETLEMTRNLSTGCTRYDLEALTITETRLGGRFPDWLGQFTKLKYLDLESNSLNGPIPESIGNFPSLIELRLSYNQLNGTIPATLGNLSVLRDLHLSSNQINGVIPAALGNLSALRELHLMYNNLNGVIPHSIGQLVNLKTFNIFSNSLEGVVSEIHLSNLSMLEELQIGSNHLAFKVKPEWIPPFQLKYIRMKSCKIGTQFPRWIEMQKDVKGLDLSNASISGPLPKWLQTLKLSFLDLSHNQIIGPLPHNIGDTMTTLGSLTLADNLINGTIPSSLCKMEFLRDLDLSENMFSGNIPNCWSNFQKLYSMKLSSNKLTGVIPRSIGNLSGLEWLHLNNNSLNRQLPLSLRNCTALKILNLGENDLSGHIPTWIGESLLELHILRLRKNMFDGYIPLQLCQLSSLQILDLADNNLVGAIPHCFGNLSVMVSGEPEIEGVGIRWYYEEVVVVMKGRDYKYMKLLRLVVNMDLSSNNLVGVIPEELTILSGLRGLNLSHNLLTGNIPTDIGNMKSLESLDFSRNQLFGSIPTRMSDLPSLSHLNLSYNNFSGQIPTGNQLQTLVDPSIYDGNPELCGPPLQKRCLGVEPPQVPSPTTHEENGKDDKYENVWFYLAISLGYATGLWAVIGVLVFKKNWRYAYFQFADETKDWVCTAFALKAAWLKKKMERNDAAE